MAGGSTGTIVHLLRHGEVHNPEGILYGRRPGYHLSELGCRMAERVAESVADRDIVHVVSSPLERARETAAPTAKVLGLEVQTDPRLIESTNVFEGKAFGTGDATLKNPKNWRYLWNPYKPSWGEPYDQVVDRMLGAILTARGRPPTATRRCWSPTSCRSGSPGCRPRRGLSSTTRASASARCAR